MNRLVATAYVGFLAIGIGTLVAEARPVYARKENQPCGYCHVRAAGGGERGFRGQYYGANGLSFELFEETREAKIAGLAADGTGVNSIPARSYNGNISGPAVQQIQVAALRGPVVVAFFSSADESAKATAKQLALIAKAYGPKVAVIGITTDSDAIKITRELGDQIRVYSDSDRKAVDKFGPKQALDFVVLAKLGDPVAKFEGFSRANVDGMMRAIKELKVSVELDLSQISDKLLRGGKL